MAIETYAEALAKGLANHPVAATLQARDELGDHRMPTTYPISTAINNSAGTGPCSRAVFETAEKRRLRGQDLYRAHRDNDANGDSN